MQNLENNIVRKFSVDLMIMFGDGEKLLQRHLAEMETTVSCMHCNLNAEQSICLNLKRV